MKGKTIHKSVHPCRRLETGIHYLVGPVVIIYIGAAADFLDWTLRMIISYISLISSIFICVMGWSHISAAAPVFIAYTEVVNSPGVFAAVFFSKLSHWRNTVEGHVFYPLAHFLNGTGTKVSVYVGFTAKLLTKLHKLMCTEAVVFYYAAPVGVNHFLSAFFWTNAVFPMIFICETSARPTKNRNLHFF